ncbi:hypothetical protein LFL96_07070 [Paraburkholderia sp. D15]|uniref:hypothetical protein n=1 Tax=Paraburkholderia sp. D15 TaxID=2880218 RepID=UPI00247B04FE|nr:hypothetical protein [Paraburkholderia sp. D15]WGS51257.1 hypothetical protein LFL96_07070 [Paraburkholderia sp. D15]
MQPTQPTRGFAPRPSNDTSAGHAASASTSASAAMRRLIRERLGETLSLAGSIAAIVIGALAFWLNQPDHLFDGAVPRRENFCVPASAPQATRPDSTVA